MEENSLQNINITRKYAWHKIVSVISGLSLPIILQLVITQMRVIIHERIVTKFPIHFGNLIYYFNSTALWVIIGSVVLLIIVRKKNKYFSIGLFVGCILILVIIKILNDASHIRPPIF